MIISYDRRADATTDEKIQSLIESIMLALNEKADEISVAASSIAEMIYPVGSIYMSVSSTNPAMLFGGTWEKIEGKFLLASGGGYDTGSTGGEAVHTLTVDEMPAHNHVMNYVNYNRGSGNNATMGYLTQTRQTNYSTTEDTGGGEAHNNMPPYLAVCVWKRIA